MSHPPLSQGTTGNASNALSPVKRAQDLTPRAIEPPTPIPALLHSRRSR